MILTESCAIVTGASRGIGLAVSEVLLSRGARVAGLARDEKLLHKVAARLGKGFLPLPCDVGRLDQVEHAVRFAREDFGQLDILVNNAGIGRFGAVDNLPKEYWDETIATNLSGTFYCIREVVPVMKAQERGHIVNIASIAGKMGYANASAYNASKFAVRGMSEALGNELAPLGIKVSAVYPGVTDTDFGLGRPAAGMPRMQPSEVAQAILHILDRSDGFLISEMVMRPMPRSGQ
jgi:NAD(P)-dependent dehydrogenase (short-subunit alcohol dehydrogenase family)